MKNKAFQTIVGQIPELDHTQRVYLKQELSTVDKKKTVCDLLEKRVEHNYQCVHCGSNSIIKHGKRSGLTRYLCKNCGKTFNTLTGTSLARLRKKELWLDYSQCILDSFSVRKSAARVQVNTETAFRWRHRFLGSSHKIEPKVLSGVVEADEIFFSKSMKGSRALKRAPRKRGKSNFKEVLPQEQVSVIVACDRNEHEADYITGLGPVESLWLDTYLTPHLSHDVLLITAKLKSFKTFSAHQHLKQKTITPSNTERADECYHLQHVNSYHCTLKTWMQRFHGVATKYLNSYLGWSHELFNRHIDNPIAFLKLAISLNQPLTGT